jgi:zinc protease
VYTREPEQQGERRFVVHRAGSDGIVALNFRTPEAAHEDTAALAVLQTMLGTGRSSRLYRTLVDTQLASDLMVGSEQLRDPGLFQVYVFVTPGVTHLEVETATLRELQRLREEPAAEAEIEKAKRIVRTRTIFGREGATNYAYELSESVSSVDWTWFFDFPESVARVTPDDVLRVARQYLRRSQLTTGWFVPSRISEDEDDFAERPEPEPGESVSAPTDYAESEAAVEAAGSAPPAPEPPRPATRPLVLPPAIARSEGEARPFGERAVRVEFENGSVVVVLEHHADPTVAVRAQVRAGSFYSPDNRLLADVTARMLRRGTARRSALRFAEDIDSLGAQIAASAGAFAVDVRAHALSQDVDDVLAAIAEMLREPAFPAAELEKVKAELAAEIRQKQDSTSARAFERLTQIVLPPAHPYYDAPASEQLADLERIGTDDIRAFYAAHYTGGGLTLAVVGDVGASAIIDAARRRFGDWGGPRPAPITFARTVPGAAARAAVRMHDKANADVVIGLPGGLVRPDPDYLAALLGNAALGQSTLSSRLGLRVRDREGLTYGISSRFYGASLVDGLWVAHVTVQPANVERAIASTIDELERALRDGITTQEVEDYKSNFAGTYKVGLATNAGIAARLIEAEFYGFGPGHLDAYAGLVAAVTVDDVNAALRRHVDLERLTIVVAGEVDEPGA